MNIKSMCFTLLSILLLAGCAGTAETGGQAEAAAAPAAVTGAGKDTGEVASAEVAKAADEDVLDPNEEICKRIRKTGTRQTSKVCATRREWELSEQQAQDATKKMQQRPQQGKEY